MRIAFAGPSGTGKTTLAAYVADRYGLELNPIGARSVATNMGFDGKPYEVIKAGRYAELQQRQLREKRAWEAAHDDFVADRTTLDVLAYTTMHACETVTEAYLAAAVDGMRRYDHVVYCPASAFLDVGGDPARKTDPTYHRLFDVVLEGMLLRWGPATLTMWDGELGARQRKIDALF